MNIENKRYMDIQTSKIHKNIIKIQYKENKNMKKYE